MNSDLWQHERFLRLVLDNIPSFVFWKDRNCFYLGCNANFAKSAGLESPNDIIGMSDYDMPWSQEESEFFRAVDQSVMETGQAQINFEEPQTINDGTIRWLRTSKIPLVNADNEIIGILGAYEDITERKSMELMLREKNERLQDLNAKLEMINTDLEQFAYATSHDLQEPLRMIGGFTGLLERKYKDILDDEGREYLGYIKEGSKRMSTLVNQILSYSRLEKVNEGFEEIDILSLVGQIEKEMAIFLRKNNAVLKLALPHQKLSCQVERIRMLFHNLISNGIKFNNSSAPTVEIRMKEQKNAWHFLISDNGIGIDTSYKEYIFQPFKRLNHRAQFPGNGVGLSICKRIVNLHGGQIWFTPNPSQGTTFHFTLPT